MALRSLHHRFGAPTKTISRRSPRLPVVTGDPRSWKSSIGVESSCRCDESDFDQIESDLIRSSSVCTEFCTSQRENTHRALHEPNIKRDRKLDEWRPRLALVRRWICWKNISIIEPSRRPENRVNLLVCSLVCLARGFEDRRTEARRRFTLSGSIFEKF